MKTFTKWILAYLFLVIITFIVFLPMRIFSVPYSDIFKIVLYLAIGYFLIFTVSIMYIIISKIVDKYLK